MSESITEQALRQFCNDLSDRQREAMVVLRASQERAAERCRKELEAVVAALTLARAKLAGEVRELIERVRLGAELDARPIRGRVGEMNPLDCFLRPAPQSYLAGWPCFRAKIESADIEAAFARLTVPAALADDVPPGFPDVVGQQLRKELTIFDTFFDAGDPVG